MKHNGGFSLIEIMVAILILGIALVGMTQGVTTALSASKESELQTSAALVAAAKIEILRAQGYVLEGSDEGDLSGDLAMYRWKETIEETDLSGLFEVTERIEHTGTSQLLYELKTMLFDPPLETEYTSEDREKTTRERLQERGRQ